MTNEEADVVFRFRIPVNVRKSVKIDWVKPETEFRIREIIKWYSTVDRRARYSVVLDENERSRFTVGIEDVFIVPEWEKFLNAKLAESRKTRRRELVKVLLAEQKTKTAVTRYIGELINEIKNK